MLEKLDRCRKCRHSFGPLFFRWALPTYLLKCKVSPLKDRGTKKTRRWCDEYIGGWEVPPVFNDCNQFAKRRWYFLWIK